MDELVKRLTEKLAERPHWLLAAHLLMLHALAFGGWQVPAVRLLWIAALGLFLMWQPFVAGEQRISLRQGSFLFAMVLASTLALGPWALLIWCGALAAAIGGRVFWTEGRRERLGYLFAFAYLIGITIFGVVPEISPQAVLDPLPRDSLARMMPLLLPILLVFPARSPKRRAGDAFDLFYGVMVFLAFAVFILGTLAYMLIGQVGYVEALFKTSLTVAGALLVVAWAWNPRAGVSGVGSAISRYLLSIGMPLEQWLVQLAESSEQESDPDRFLDRVMQRLRGLPWVLGAAWQCGSHAGQFGDKTAFVHSHRNEDIGMAVYFSHSPSPAMRWHVDWLLQLAVAFYLVKRQAHELQRLGYLQAVYETGARVTHDVKNLLQSMQVLCYAAAQPGDPAELARLLGRQLPQITERLKGTLDKLQSPRLESFALVDATLWWHGLQDRYANAPIDWSCGLLDGKMIPRALFDSVAENLLQNALAKRQRGIGVAIAASFVDGRFTVTDDGDPIAPELAKRLLSEPVGSEDGLGIGLYHAARQAESAGYGLCLSSNLPGCVAFSLSARS